MSKQTPWPSQAQTEAATNHKPPTVTNPLASGTGDPLTEDLMSLVATLQQSQAESIVVIGINAAGELIQMRRPGPIPHPYAMVGGLEAMKAHILQSEVGNQSIPGAEEQDA